MDEEAIDVGVEEDSAPDPAQTDADDAWGELEALAEAAADDTSFDRPIRQGRQEPQEEEGEEEAPGVAEWRARYQEAEQRNAGFHQMLSRVMQIQQDQQRRYEEQRQIDIELAQQVQAERRQASLPDPSQDPLRWMDARLTASEEAIQARFAEQEARQNAEREQQQQQAVANAVGTSMARAEADWPEFPDAVRYLAAVKQHEFSAAGVDPSRIGEWLNVTANQALFRGQDPGEVLYQLAVNAGFYYEEPQQDQPPPQDPRYAARQARSREASSRQGPRSSATQGGQLRQSDVENMSDKEVQDLIAMGDEGFERLFAPYFVG